MIETDHRDALKRRARTPHACLPPHRRRGAVAPQEVLTAAHCLWNRRVGGWLPPASLHFLAGYRQGDYLAHRRVRAIRIAAGMDMDARGHPRHLADDWAILTLDQPVSTDDRLRPVPLADDLSTRAIAVGYALTRAGYSQDRAHLLMLATCHAQGHAGAHLLLHDCDATFGDSGSPIMIDTPAGWRVAAIHVATGGRDRKSYGMALLVTALAPKR